MKKILVVTINDYLNYGNRLQNYALIKILKKMGFDASNAPQVCCKENYICGNDAFWKKVLKMAMPFSMWKNRMKKIFHYEETERYFNFLKFAKLYNDFPKIIYCRKNAELREKLGEDEIDFFIAGSDQVWNPSFFSNLYVNMLGFAPASKKIAVAPSISIDKLEKWQEKEMEKYLPSFNFLSCREKDGSKILQRLSGKNVETIIDPTLMLDKKEWDQVAKKPVYYKDKEKYILIYFLGNILDKYNSVIKDISRKFNLKIINIGDAKSVYYQCGPSEFIWLVKHCELMLTDSFHGTVFSYIYDRPVKVFHRSDNLSSMNSRLTNLIDTLKLNRIYFEDINLEEDNLFEVAYDKSYLLREQEHFQTYLNISLSVKTDN